MGESQGEEVKLVLPFPPSANLYWRMWRGRMVVSTEARKYKRDVKLLAAGVKPFDGSVAVRVDVFRPAKRGDLDNCLKVLLDALKGVAFNDDSQVEHIEAHRFENKLKPRAEVQVIPLSFLVGNEGWKPF